MNQQEFQQLINADRPISITNELMGAARESAMQHRNEAMIYAGQWVRTQFRTVFGRAQAKPSHCHS